MAWHRRCGCWLSPVSARRAGWAPAPWRAAWKGRQCCLQALETHVGTAVGLATWLQGGQAALSGHRRAVAQEPLLVPWGRGHPRASVGAPVTWSWKRRRASSLRGRLWALGWGREGQQLLVGTGGESTPSGPGWWGQAGVGGPCCILGWAAADGGDGVAAPCPRCPPEVSHLLWAGPH